MPDWAEDKAREWLEHEACDYCADVRLRKAESLAALLREVHERGSHEALVVTSAANAGEWARCERETLAEVRRVVGELMGGERNQLVSGDYLLSRLEKL